MLRDNNGESLLLGIDLGTTLIKAVIFDAEGKQLVSSSREISIEYPRICWAEQDPEEIWKNTCIVIKECLRKGKIDPNAISGLSLTGQMHGTFLVDEEDKLARKKAIIWLDSRSQDILNEYYEKGFANEIYDISGWKPITSMQLMHLSWLKKNEPHVLEKTKCFLACKDYIRYKLTGELYTDITDASVTGLMNILRGEWSKKLINAVGIPENIFPEIRNSWESGGEITDEASKKTGLKRGTPVAIGAGDICATALGAGVVKPSQLCAIIGTAGIYELVSDKPILDPTRKYFIACHAVPNSWLLVAAQMTAGATLRWFRDEFCHEERTRAKEKGVSAYTIMDEEASHSPIGADGVMFLPFLQGERSPFVKPTARGVFYGLSLWTKRNDVIRAILEGIAYAAKDNIGLFKNSVVKEARITGGGGVSKLWCQIFSDVLNLKILIPKIKECGALGSAINASVVARIYQNSMKAAEKMVKVYKVFNPNPENVRKYEKLFSLYKKLYQKLWNYYDYAWKIYTDL